MNPIKLCLYVAAVMFTAILIAGCAAPTTNTTSSPTSTTAHGQAPTALDAQISAHYKLIDNFTRISEENETPVYTAAFQDTNGTLHSVTLYFANSTEEAQAQFKAQKESYSTSLEAEPNTTVTANTSTYWAITTDANVISVWQGEPQTPGPFGLNVDVPYVLVSEDMKPLAA